MLLQRRHSGTKRYTNALGYLSQAPTHVIRIWAAEQKVGAKQVEGDLPQPRLPLPSQPLMPSLLPRDHKQYEGPRERRYAATTLARPRRSPRSGRGQGAGQSPANHKQCEGPWEPPTAATTTARPEGFEPPTCGFEVRCSIQLS